MNDRTAESFRSSIRTVVDMAPPAPEIALSGKHRTHSRPVLAAVSGFAVVVVLFGLFTLALRTSAPTLEPRTTEEPAATATTQPEPDLAASIPHTPDAVTLIRAGGPVAQLVGIRFHEIVVSDDNGASWTTFFTTAGEVDVLDVTPEGDIVAIESTPGSLRGTITSDSYSNATPQVHTYRHAEGEWKTTELPRPPYPEPDDRQNWWRCEIGGVEDYVSATSVAAGPTVAILGGHSMADNGSCGGGAFLWTSTDGTAWTIDPLQRGLTLNGIAWIENTYVGYGTGGDAWYDAKLWESSDLADWVPARLSSEVAVFLASTPISLSGGTGGINYAGPIPLGTRTALVFPVHELTVEIPEDLTTLEELRAALEGDPDLLATLDQDVARLGVSFPPTSAQLALLESFYEASSTTIGRVVLTRSADGVWTRENG